MRTTSRWLLGLLVAGSVIGGAKGDEVSTSTYVNGLRQNGYADWAIDYLEIKLNEPGVKKERKMEIEYEIASSLISLAETMGDLSKQEKGLEDARAKFEEFGKKYPSAPDEMKADALVQVATIDLQQGRLRIIQAQIPSNESQALGLANQARGLLDKSSKAYGAAEKLYEVEYKKFPAYIGDETQKDRADRAKRSEIFSKWIETRFQTALAKFYLADSYDAIPIPKPDEKNAKEVADFKATTKEWADKYKKEIEEARKGFDEIYVNYRGQLVGLYGHLWMARCLADQGQHRKAMGIYEQLMEHEDPRLARFQREVFYFEMLSYAQRDEFKLLVTQAEPWLRANIRFQQERPYLGVQLEVAKAFITLADNATDDREKSKYYSQANDILKKLVSTPNEYRGLASREQMRLQGKANIDANENSFSQLFAAANTKLDRVKPGITPQEQLEYLTGARDELKRALEVASSREDPDQVRQAELTLAYTFYMLKEYDKAAVLATYIATEYPKSSVGAQAATFAINCYAMGYQDADALMKATGFQTQADADAGLVRKMADYIIQRWPDGKEADEARMIVGRLETARKNYEEATLFLDQVTPTSTSYAEALRMAGTNYWQWYGSLTRPGMQTDPKVLADLIAKAQDRLTKASKPLHDQAGNKITTELYINDAQLGEVFFEKGEDEKTLGTIGPLVQAIATGAVPEQIEKPMRSFVLITALKAFIRKNEMGPTDMLMDLIAKNQSGPDAGNITKVYVMLAMNIKQQLTRLEEAGQKNEADKTRAAFEAFLDKIANRPDQTLQALVYIGNSYVELGKQDKAKGILEKAISHSEAQNPESENIIRKAKLELARANSKLGNNDEAIAQINDLFKKNSKNLEIVFERGTILDEAGSAKQKDAIIHWKYMVKMLQNQKPRPQMFYDVMDNLMKNYHEVKGADREKRNLEGYKYATFLLTTDTQLPPDMRPVFKKHQEEFAAVLKIQIPKSEDQASAK